MTEAIGAGARKAPACAEAGLTLRTFQRWLSGTNKQEDARTTVHRPPPGNKLSEAERQAVLTTCHQSEYTHLPPSQIVPRLADKGIYLACESTMYRVLKAEGETTRRGRAQAPRKHPQPTSHQADAANQVWSWDITYLPTQVRGQFYYLYLVEDIFSRKGVGWEVHEQESGEQAAALIQRTVMAEQCFGQPLVLHSDNGAPMKSATLLAKLYDLGITPSRGRPRVSNDNPYSESLFRTLKYCPQWPERGFASLTEARQWVSDFMDWYNHEHCHSRLRFVTPAQRHRGEDHSILAKRHEVYQAAKARTPQRWSGQTRNWTPVGTVMLNPERAVVESEKAA